MEDDPAIVEVRVEIVDMLTHTKTVDPVPEHLLLSCLLNDIDHLLWRRGLKTRMVVEQIRNKGQVKFLMAIHNIL